MSCIPTLMVHAVNDCYTFGYICEAAFKDNTIKKSDIQKCKTAIHDLQRTLNILNTELEIEMGKKL